MSTRAGYKQLTRSDRLKIETLLNAGHKQVFIANALRVSRSTISREIKRGLYDHMNSDLTVNAAYSADKAQKRCDLLMSNRGTQLKIGKDIKFANYLERRMKEGYAPAAVLGELKAKGLDVIFDTTICAATLYSYIDKGIFLEITNKDLPVKKKKKRKYKKVRVQKRANAGTSIEKRPPEVDTREEFGHWEMDSVVGPQGKSKNTLLVLSERKTRMEIIRKLADHSSASVVDALNELEKEWKEIFGKVFKTITMDNGTEFSATEEMEKSCLADGNRIDLYYCHPYRSSERGTNENINRLIRRWIPKGVNFDGWSDKDVERVEHWINHYPRRIHGYHTASDLFEAEIAALK